MNTTLKQQIEAIQKARTLIKKIGATVKMDNKGLDAALNDAGSTIAAINLSPPSPQTNSRHTPGPWTLEYDYNLVMPFKRGGQVVTAGLIGPDEAHSEEKRANMQLISAAPDLLEALTDLVKAHDLDMGKSAIEVRIEIAREAIKKANP